VCVCVCVRACLCVVCRYMDDVQTLYLLT
jgi:hypothetical protein